MPHLNLPLKKTPGRSQVVLTPSGGLTRSGRFVGVLYMRSPWSAIRQPRHAALLAA